MHKIRIQTAQNVEIEYEVASIGDRIVAYLIDLLLIVAYGVVVFLLALAASEFSPFEMPSSLGVGLAILLVLPIFLYDLVLEIVLDGQSFGKRRRGIKVVKIDGSQPGIGNYLLRWLLRVIDLSLLSGGVALLTILINGKGQRLGDLAAGTAVVKLRPQATLSDTILTSIDAGYTPVFPSAARLSENAITTVKEVLSQATVLQEGSEETAAQLLGKTKAVLENAMEIKSDLPPRDFLETVMKDYNALMAGGAA